MASDPKPPRYSMRNLLVMVTLLAPLLTFLDFLDFPPAATATAALAVVYVVVFCLDLGRSDEGHMPSYRKRQLRSSTPAATYELGPHDTRKDSIQRVGRRRPK